MVIPFNDKSILARRTCEDSRGDRNSRPKRQVFEYFKACGVTLPYGVLQVSSYIVELGAIGQILLLTSKSCAGQQEVEREKPNPSPHQNHTTLTTLRIMKAFRQDTFRYYPLNLLVAVCFGVCVLSVHTTAMPHPTMTMQSPLFITLLCNSRGSST